VPSIPIDAQPAAWAEALHRRGRRSPPLEELEADACTPGLVPGEIEAAVALACAQMVGRDAQSDPPAAASLWAAHEDDTRGQIASLSELMAPFPGAESISPAGPHDSSTAATAAAAEALDARSRRNANRRGFVVHFHGPDQKSRRLAAIALGASLQSPSYWLDLRKLAAGEPARACSHIEDLVQLADWFSALLFLEPLESLPPGDSGEAHPAVAALGAHLAMTELTVVLGGDTDAHPPAAIDTRIDLRIRVGGSP
jgi:hypothetical protein